MTDQNNILSYLPELLLDFSGYLLFLIILFGSITTLVFLFIGKNASKPALLVLFALFAILLMTGPSLFRLKKSDQMALKIICRSNLGQLSTHVISEIDHSKVNNEDWCDEIKNKVEPHSFLCMGDKIGPCSYAMNENIPEDASELPADLVVLFESAPGWNNVGGPEDVVTDRHGKTRGANIAFADGHVEFIKAEDIPKLKWTLEEQPQDEQ